MMWPKDARLGNLGSSLVGHSDVNSFLLLFHKPAPPIALLSQLKKTLLFQFFRLKDPGVTFLSSPIHLLSLYIFQKLLSTLSS